MAVQVQSTDVFLCYQRLRVSCALCNNFQAARPRQTTERRLAPLYVEHMLSLFYSKATVNEIHVSGHPPEGGRINWLCNIIIANNWSCYLDLAPVNVLPCHGSAQFLHFNRKSVVCFAN